jgi:hypothetical protein
VPYRWSRRRRRSLLIYVWVFRALLALFTLLTLVGVVLAVAHDDWGRAARLVGSSIPVFLILGLFTWLGQHQLDGPVWGRDLPHDPSQEQRYEAWRCSREARVTMGAMTTFSAGLVLLGAATRNWGILILAAVSLVMGFRGTLIVFGRLEPRRFDRWPPK